MPVHPRLLRSKLRFVPSQHVSWQGHDLDRAQPVLQRLELLARYGSPVRDTDCNCLPLWRGAAENGIDEGDWRKASYSLGNGECIEVADGPVGRTAVRDSKNPAGSILVYSAVEWKSFLAKIKI